MYQVIKIQNYLLRKAGFEPTTDEIKPSYSRSPGQLGISLFSLP